jgi:arylsulfatase A-like enzyme
MPPTRTYPGHGAVVGRRVADSRPWWPEPARPPAGAPNIVVVFLDDMGYSDVGPFGSEIPTPALDRLAARGLRLMNYHTTPLCSPARAALLTGLNPHRAGYASVANFDPGFPGYTMELGDDVATLPEILRGAGYATFAVGKWHLTRDAAMHDGASRSSWPCQRGFDRYYGFLEGLTNLHHPHRLVRDNSPVDLDRYPDGYYLTDDLTDEAIGMIKGLRASEARRPFFLYVAHGAVHAPLQAKPADIARHRGRYDAGWDRLREERFARQVDLGFFPPGAPLPDRNREAGWEVEPWESHTPEERDRFARYQEVYAAMVDNVDQNLGRLLGAIEALGELDDTVVVFASDNGATGEGGATGTRSYFKQFGSRLPPDWVLDVPRDLDLVGGPRAFVHYPRGWGMASNTPFRLYKSTTHAGGVRVPFVISWPNGIAADLGGGLRRGYQYVTDVLPTLLELAGVGHPAGATTDGQEGFAQPDGCSFAASLRDPDAPGTRGEQYSECFGNRSFYRQGWKLVALHRPGTPHDDSDWELYDIATDPTEVRDLAGDRPDMVKELSDAWEEAAWDNKVFPLEDPVGWLPVARRPDEHAWSRPVTILPGTPTLERYRASRLIAFRDFTVEISLNRHGRADEGVLVAHGDQGGGYSVYVEGGHLWLAYNQYGELFEVDAGPLADGSSRIVLDARYRPELQWRLALTVDGERRSGLPGVQMLVGVAPFTGIDVGVDRRSPVSWPVYERHGPFPYTGILDSVTYRPGQPAPVDPAQILAALVETGRVFE